MSRESSCHRLLRSGILGPFPQLCRCLFLYLCFYIVMALFSYWLLIYSYCTVCLYELTAKLKGMLSLFASNCDYFLQSHWAWCLLVLMCTILMCVGPDACSPDVCCPDLYWSSNACRGEEHILYSFWEAQLSLRERVVFITARPSCLRVPSVLSAFCCSAAAFTVSIPSHTPWSRIQVKLNWMERLTQLGVLLLEGLGNQVIR